jgi:hypothetical protein
MIHLDTGQNLPSSARSHKGEDDYAVIARSAFGEMHLGGLKSGANISIDPLYCTIRTSPPSARVTQEKQELAMGSFFATKNKKSFDFDDINEKALFKKALKKTGTLGVR